MAGDKVFIHWKETAYKEKWVINRKGTELKPIKIIGVNDPQGQQPIIDGNGAVTVKDVNFWNEPRGVIKIGGSNKPEDGLPEHIIIENLEIKSGRPPYQFTNDKGTTESYVKNAASIYVEKAANLTIRNCTLHDSGNGLFIGAFDGQTKNILIEKNYIYNNGNDGSIYEHNTYTAAIDITYQYNRFGPLRTGARGNNLKDRSAGLVVRYNWIEGGNRQLDLVDAEDSKELVNHPHYNTTYAYGNILIEPDNDGNSQMVHYGGDSGTKEDYRKGDFYFYNNTIISTRSGNTTLIRLSTNDEKAHVFNNVLYPTASGGAFALMGGNGIINIENNWFKTGWKECHCTPDGQINDNGNNIEGSDPLFENFSEQKFKPKKESPLLNKGKNLPSILVLNHNLSQEYVKHLGSGERNSSGELDLGAFEFGSTSSIFKLKHKINATLFYNQKEQSILVSLENEILDKIDILSISGKKIISHSQNKAPINHLKPGIYIIRITTRSKKILTKKFIRS